MKNIARVLIMALLVLLSAGWYMNPVPALALNDVAPDTFEDEPKDEVGPAEGEPVGTYDELRTMQKLNEEQSNNNNGSDDNNDGQGTRPDDELIIHESNTGVYNQ